MTREENFRKFRSDLDRKFAIDQVTTFARSGLEEPSQLDVFECHSRSRKISGDTSVVFHVVLALLTCVLVLTAACFIMFLDDFYAAKDLIKGAF